MTIIVGRRDSATAEEVVHRCPEQSCKKVFRTKKTLKEHFRFHSDSNPYTCSVCNKSFKWRSSLSSHKNTHGTGRSSPSVQEPACLKAIHVEDLPEKVGAIDREQHTETLSNSASDLTQSKCDEPHSPSTGIVGHMSCDESIYNFPTYELASVSMTWNNE
mmetsp:Transcript_6076/g.18360  ORF Transcript_6076/g.18360 Transcript_6076/m.18360 type:complete len:160 (-) Transcript_6076:208-687(-)